MELSEAWAQEPDLNRLRAADALVSADPERALREYQDLAKIGSTMSLLALGVMYERGLGVARDVSRSFEYYALASEKGSTRATFNLEKLYYSKHDFEKAEELFLIGASQNDFRAMYWLAQLYRTKSVYRSEKTDEAVALLRKAMLIGHVQSGRVLGSMLMRGNFGFLNTLKGILYFCCNTAKAIFMVFKNPANEFLLDMPKFEFIFSDKIIQGRYHSGAGKYWGQL